MALPSLGQECLRSETELIEKVNFDLGHPVPGDHGDVHEHVVGDGLGVHDDHDGHDHENPVD